MIIRIRILNWRFTLTFAPVVNVIGVNSKLPGDKHIIMWDFDDIPLDTVAAELEIVQLIYELPNIYILSSGAPNHYIAYCFHRCKWRDSIEIVAATPSVDASFFKYGVYREHWTLRVSPKEGRKPQLAYTLKSQKRETANISELNSWVKDVQRQKPSKLLSDIISHSDSHKNSPMNVASLNTPAQNMRHLLTRHQ